MANMSYCRFENTHDDLLDCFEALMDADGVENYEKNCNDREKPYVKKLLKLCREIIENFEDEF